MTEEIKPLEKIYVTSPYGKKRGNRRHAGVDLRAPIGSPVFSTTGGEVVSSRYSKTYGNVIEVENKEEDVWALYAHLSERLVEEGDQVKRGEVIAKSGNTGRSTGPHLHYEVKVGGVNINPLHYLQLLKEKLFG